MLTNNVVNNGRLLRYAKGPTALYMCVNVIHFFPFSTIFRIDFGTVLLMWYFFIWRCTYNILDSVMTSYSTRRKLTFTLTARPVTVTWTQSWAISVICTYTIAQTWITVAWIHWKNIILYTNSWCSKSNTIPNMYILQLRFFLSCSIHYAHLVFDRQLSRGDLDLFDLV